MVIVEAAIGPTVIAYIAILTSKTTRNMNGRDQIRLANQGLVEPSITVRVHVSANS
jgi:hypothetical protein